MLAGTAATFHDPPLLRMTSECTDDEVMGFCRKLGRLIASGGTEANPMRNTTYGFEFEITEEEWQRFRPKMHNRSCGDYLLKFRTRRSTGVRVVGFVNVVDHTGIVGMHPEILKLM